MSLQRATARGVVWSSIERVAGQGLQLATTVLLIRLLTPKDFGLLAMVTVFIGFAMTFSEFGFGSALIQKQDITPQHTSSVFWTNVLLGMAITAIFFFSAPLLASFYNAPLLESLTRALAFTFTINAFSIVPRALLARAMHFQRLAKAEIIAVTIAGISAVCVALVGWGVWALVVQNLIREMTRSLATLLLANWRPEARFSLAAIKDFIKYGSHLSGFQFINYWARNSDNLLIGKYLSVSSLGIYTRAYSILLIPLTQLIGALTQVMFPALSSIQNDIHKVRDVYLRAMGIISFLIYPAMLGLLVAEKPFTLTLLGAHWLDSAYIIQIFCIVSLSQAICNPTGWIYMSQGRTDWMFRWGLFGSTSLIVAIVIGVYFGSIESVAIAYLVATLLITYPCIAIPGKLIQMTFMDVIRAIAPSFICASIMAFLVWCIGATLPETWSASIHLTVQVFSGTIIYLVLAGGFRLKACRELCQITAEQFGVKVEAIIPALGSLGNRYRSLIRK